MSLQLPEYLSKGINILKQRIDLLVNFLYKKFMDNIKYLLVFSLVISAFFGIMKTLFFTGYNVDSYQFYAVSIEKWLRTGVEDRLFDGFYVKNRIVFPLIIALIHICIPIDVSLLGCTINLIFAFGSIIVIRKLLKLYNYSEEEIDLFSLFTILSYNFMNFWFNILTDMVSLFFFLLMLLCLEFYSLDIKANYWRRLLYLALSIISFFLTFYSREIYFIAGALFFIVIKPRKLRIVVIVILFWLSFLILEQNRSEIMSFMTFFPKEYWNAFQSSDYIEFFFSVNQRWESSSYIFNFIKGLVKVGILPSVLIILITLLIIVLKKIINADKSQSNPFPERTSPSQTISFSTSAFNMMYVWFILYFFAYSLFFSDLRSATGLRYWLPISWIPLALVAKIISQKIKSRYLKLSLILFLCLFPFSWSTVELYINRNNITGTGPIYKQNYYFNDMGDLMSIRSYNRNYISISVLNHSYFKTVILNDTSDKEGGYLLSRFSFPLWLNATNIVTIETRLLSPNNASWGITLYEVNWDYTPGYGNQKYDKQQIEGSSEFQLYRYEFNLTSHLRMVFLTVGGGINSTILWDYLKIEIS